MENTNEYFASINDVSKRLNVPAHTLRYWEKQFPVAIRPTTGAGGRRYYRTETVAKLIVIRDLLYTHGLTIAGVKKLLRDGNLPSSADELLMNPPVVQDMTNVVAAPSVDISDLNLAISLLETAKNILQ
ncbi:MAG: MerR family transcriptional regulator [Alphaproteobacteria bacterium]|nr:MerR family transcriptional regulator [Alphaproteobacteria bacterium]